MTATYVGIVALLLVLLVVAVIAYAMAARKARSHQSLEDLADALDLLPVDRPARLSIVGRDDLTGRVVDSVNAILERQPRPQRVQDRLFEELLDTVRDAVLVHRESVLVANERFAKLLGRSAAEIVGKPLWQLVTPDYADIVYEHVKRALAGQVAPDRFEVEISDPHGQVTRVELTGRPVDYAGSGAMLYAAAEMVAHGAARRAPAGRARRPHSIR